MSIVAEGNGCNADNRFEEQLAARLSGPPADRVFRAELRGRLLATHPAAAAAGGRQPASSRAERLAARRRRSRWPLVGLAAAVVLAIVIAVARQAFVPAPLAQLGMLPRPAAEPAQSGGAGGPGYGFDITYVLTGQLAAGWPELPGQARAYRLRPPEFSADHVADLASRLGIAAPVVQEGWQDTYLLAADPGDGSPSLRMFPGGYTIYMRPYDYSPTGRPELPSDSRALDIGREWLTSMGFVPEGSLGDGSVEFDAGNGMLYVSFRPEQPEPIVSIPPYAIVQIGRDETVVTGLATWFGPDAESPYPLRGPQDAWEIVARGEGVLDYEVREFAGPVGEDNVIRGQANVGAVRLAWWLATDGDGVPYLVPVYAFSGQLSVPGRPGGAESFPFEAWAPAVQEAHIQG